jgi:hypothetical protein
MKPLWMQTLAWIAAIAVAVLFALANPDSNTPIDVDSTVPHGSVAPR